MDALYGFDSGMSLSFVHDRIGRAVTGFATGGLLGAARGIVTSGGVPGEIPPFEPGEPLSISEARFSKKQRTLVGRGACSPPLIRDQSGICVFPGSPGDISTDVASNGVSSIAASGRLSVPPIRASVMVDKCPKFADGATGILWMNALTGQVVCLPRRANGTAFGLIRKNKPRRKPFISAAQKKQLDAIKSVQGKAKAFATAAGFTCTNTKRTVKGTPKKKS